MSSRERLSSKRAEIKKEGRGAPKQQTGSSRPPASLINQVLLLQRTIGNQAVQRLFTTGAIQPKLKIGLPNDIYEQEADRVADEVMRMPEPMIQPKPPKLEVTPLVQRQVEEEKEILTKPLAEQITPLIERQVELEEEEEEEPIQTKLLSPERSILQEQEEIEEEEKPLMTKGISSGTQQVGDDVHMRLNQNRGSGQTLPEADSNFMERRFGIDFSGVRVHTGSDAVQTSRELNAQAFTYGRDIYFGVGRYSPGTSSGRKLLAHELTHVVQQSLMGFESLKAKYKPIARSRFTPFFSLQCTIGNRKVSKLTIQESNANIIQRVSAECRNAPPSVTLKIRNNTISTGPISILSPGWLEIENRDPIPHLLSFIKSNLFNPYILSIFPGNISVVDVSSVRRERRGKLTLETAPNRIGWPIIICPPW